jgi:hypothetical protein
LLAHHNHKPLHGIIDAARKAANGQMGKSQAEAVRTQCVRSCSDICDASRPQDTLAWPVGNL